jgi:tRNA (adenine-N(1)-)-methyltransferase non-catalytic subunit
MRMCARRRAKALPSKIKTAKSLSNKLNHGRFSCHTTKNIGQHSESSIPKHIVLSISMTDHVDDGYDPLMHDHDSIVKEGHWVILHFADGKQIFGQCLTNSRGKTPPIKINKRSYPTFNLIGLPYGTVLELQKNRLEPLADGEDLLPDILSTADDADVEQSNDNRSLIDDNQSQALKSDDLRKLIENGTDGSKIIQSLIENSATFDSKTDFSKQKYIVRKQLKYQPRCRLVKCSGRTICEALYWKDSRKIMNLRDDTLGQMLSYANICAGRQVLVYDTAMGIVTGSLAQRMGGYGKILSLYSGQQPAWMDTIDKFNLSFGENQSIKWLHCEDIFANEVKNGEDNLDDEEDIDAKDRDNLLWPCPLQAHTRQYLETMNEKEVAEFLAKRCTRFTRKLTRTSPLEARAMLLARPSDSVLIATKNDPTETLMGMLPHLGSSCPFVVFCEYMEPLAHCFLELQRNNLAINLRLSDTWMREYQVLPGRTHPHMTMSQNGGFLLTGIKLDPVHGKDEMDEATRREIREQIGGRRGKKKRGATDLDDEGDNTKKARGS